MILWTLTWQNLSYKHYGQGWEIGGGCSCPSLPLGRLVQPGILFLLDFLYPWIKGDSPMRKNPNPSLQMSHGWRKGALFALPALLTKLWSLESWAKGAGFFTPPSLYKAGRDFCQVPSIFSGVGALPLDPKSDLTAPQHLDPIWGLKVSGPTSIPTTLVRFLRLGRDKPVHWRSLHLVQSCFSGGTVSVYSHEFHIKPSWALS